MMTHSYESLSDYSFRFSLFFYLKVSKNGKYSRKQERVGLDTETER